MIGFQNCSPFSSFVSPSTLSSLKANGGNGEPYDGKPTYTHLVPGLTCSNQQVAVGRIDIQGQEAHISSIVNACENKSTVVPVSALETSSFSDKYLGYGGSVYTLTSNED